MLRDKIQGDRTLASHACSENGTGTLCLYGVVKMVPPALFAEKVATASLKKRRDRLRFVTNWAVQLRWHPTFGSSNRRSVGHSNWVRRVCFERERRRRTTFQRRPHVLFREPVLHFILLKNILQVRIVPLHTPVEHIQRFSPGQGGVLRRRGVDQTSNRLANGLAIEAQGARIPAENFREDLK